ncbi:hypothetical protein SS50377_28315 [Spironucleus salmonicida]|uniref:Uncharacterized protein n=1 Tax=Spironucleus salmonicida TaxID=348837 RepID=V6LS14_9EUKA|nr:hypothetical protein SS50377_28315 [Spironucleus salmonicida]|eukprot:EST47365.1 Hypothetical protein SS50377_12574 [Spironucleus salmonicida]
MPIPIADPKNRPFEQLSFNDKDIIFQDFQNGYVEYQFEELRLRDIRSNQYGREILRTDFENPLSKQNISQQVVNSPTINMQYALAELGPLLYGTPTLTFGNLDQPNLQDPTINFAGLQSSIVGMEQRNADRGLALKLDDVL